MTNAFIDASSGMPTPTTQTMPQVVSPPPPTQPGLMPAALLNPLPSITASVPVVMNPCDGITQLISDNPLIAVGALFGLYWMFWRKG